MKINEFGRTMVEMLGVLAIMGILSLTAVFAFRTAMNKMTANKIVELVGEMSLEAQGYKDAISLDTLDVDAPRCINKMTGAPSGQVLVDFLDNCDSIEALVSGSFNACRWVEYEKESHTYLFLPSRSAECKEKSNELIPGCTPIPGKMDCKKCKKWGKCIPEDWEGMKDRKLK